MRRCEDEKVRDRPSLLEEPCAQTLSGTMDFVRHITAGGLQSIPCRFLGDWPCHRWARARWLQLCGIGGHFGPDATTLVATRLEVEPVTCFDREEVPSGKLLHNYGKSPWLMGKSTISMAIFNSYFDITRGYILCFFSAKTRKGGTHWTSQAKAWQCTTLMRILMSNRGQKSPK